MGKLLPAVDRDRTNGLYSTREAEDVVELFQIPCAWLQVLGGRAAAWSRAVVCCGGSRGGDAEPRRVFPVHPAAGGQA